MYLYTPLIFFSGIMTLHVCGFQLSKSAKKSGRKPRTDGKSNESCKLYAHIITLAHLRQVESSTTTL